MSILKNAAVLVGSVLLSANAVASELNVISDRSDFHVRPVLQAFEEITGIDVNVVFVDKGTIPARLAAGVDNADVVIATDLPTLVVAKEKGFTESFDSKVIADLATQNKADPENHYSALSYRSRTIVYNKSVVNPADLTGYMDLADSKYKGRVCVRPWTHPYNITLLSEMIVDRGEEWTRNWIANVDANLAVEPTGNDRMQGTLVSQGVCDVGLMNSYYYGLLLSNNKQRDVANKTQLFFPDQSGEGSFVLYSGIAKAKGAENDEEARMLAEFMLGTIGQNHFAHVNYEYPVKDGVAISTIAKGFGEGQAGVEKGTAKFNHVDPVALAEVRELAVEIATEFAK